MTVAQKKLLLLSTTAFATFIVYLHSPIPQPLSFHHFADTRPFLGIPNFGNVISNIPFLFFGIYGLLSIPKANAPKGILPIYTAMFLGILLTGLGSAWYHYNPDNNTLVYDRIPMTLVFMSLLAATVAEFINRKTGTWLLAPLLLIGIISVWSWHLGELKGQGDLRLYFLVQYYPMLAIPLIMFLYYDPSHKPVLRPLCRVVVWYIIAKVFEQEDWHIYSLGGWVSGHSLKHLTAGVSTLYLVRLFRVKYVSWRTNA